MWRFLVVMSVVLGLFLGCGDRRSADSDSVFVAQKAAQNHTLLRVKDTEYFRSDFEAYLRLSIGKEHEGLSSVSLSRLFDNFAEEMILLKAAQEQEVSLSWDEKKEYLAKLTNESRLKEDRKPLDESEQKFLFKRLLIEKYTYLLVKDMKVEEEEIREYYNQNKREFLLPERVKVRQILLSSEEKAVEILKRLENSDAKDFKKMAQEESMGVEASKGGEMGVFAMGQLPSEMDRVVFSLKEGELSPVLESSYGYHIFRLDARLEPELVPLEKAASSIRVKLLSQKIKDHISQHIEYLKDAMEWDVYPQNLHFPYQRIFNE